MKENKSVVLVGYHGKENFGDDIFRRVILNFLVENLNVGTCYVACGAGSNLELSNNIRSLSVRPFGNPFPFIARLRWIKIFIKSMFSDALVFAGGSIFTHQEFELIRYVIKAIKLLRGRRYKIFAIGVSIGPFANESKRLSCIRLLDEFDMVILRDKESLGELVGFDHAIRYKVGYDLATLLNVSSFGVASEKSGSTLGISLTPRAFPKSTGGAFNDHFQSFVTVIEKALEDDPNLRVIIMSFCADKVDGAEYISTKLFESLGHWGKKVELVLYQDKEFDIFLEKINSCDGMIASRMHAGIVGILSGIPVFQISYARKVFDFYDHHGIPKDWMFSSGQEYFKELSKFIQNLGSKEISGDFSARAKSLHCIGINMNEILMENIVW